MNQKLLKNMAISLMLAVCLVACSASKESGNDEFETKTEEEEPSIDLNNVKDLFAQPLPLLQKSLIGKWKLISVYGGIEGKSQTAFDDDYMILTQEHIEMGNKTSGIIIDSPLKWENLANFNGYPTASFISYNFQIAPNGNILGYEKLLPQQIIEGVLTLWDLRTDGYFYVFTKYL